MNYSLIAADRMTHIRIVAVALIVSIAVATVGIYARPTLAGTASHATPAVPALAAAPKSAPAGTHGNLDVIQCAMQEQPARAAHHGVL